jgi:hypothetical protein
MWGDHSSAKHRMVDAQDAAVTMPGAGRQGGGKEEGRRREGG